MGLKWMQTLVKAYPPGTTTPAQQALLLALAYHMNDKTRACYVGNESLVAFTHLGETTIKANRRVLLERGYLRKVQEGRVLPNGVHLSTVYDINFEPHFDSAIGRPLRPGDELPPVLAEAPLPAPATAGAGGRSSPHQGAAAAPSRGPLPPPNGILRNENLQRNGEDASSAARLFHAALELAGLRGGEDAAFERLVAELAAEHPENISAMLTELTVLREKRCTADGRLRGIAKPAAYLTSRLRDVATRGLDAVTRMRPAATAEDSAQSSCAEAYARIFGDDGKGGGLGGGMRDTPATRARVDAAAKAARLTPRGVLARLQSFEDVLGNRTAPFETADEQFAALLAYLAPARG